MEKKKLPSLTIADLPLCVAKSGPCGRITFQGARIRVMRQLPFCQEKICGYAVAIYFHLVSAYALKPLLLREAYKHRTG